MPDTLNKETADKKVVNALHQNTRHTRDLGEFDEPLLIFGGNYSNLQATAALKAIADQRGIPGERCIGTGDLVAYCGQPSETVALIRAWGAHCLLGNCEASLAANADDCGCGFDAGSACDVLSGQWFDFTKNRLSDDDKQWFSTLPEHIIFRVNTISTLVVHGSPSSINQFIFPSSDSSIFEQEYRLLNNDIRLIVGGHSGIPFTKKIHSRVWHNSGAIGMPANDGTTDAWYSIITPNNKGIELSHHRLRYDYQEAHRQMQKNGMNNTYASALLTGHWPSTDILTPEEKKLTGHRLQERVAHLPNLIPEFIST